jgi:hypothetical protein
MAPREIVIKIIVWVAIVIVTCYFVRYWTKKGIIKQDKREEK